MSSTPIDTFSGVKYTVHGFSARDGDTTEVWVDGVVFNSKYEFFRSEEPRNKRLEPPWACPESVEPHETEKLAKYEEDERYRLAFKDADGSSVFVLVQEEIELPSEKVEVPMELVKLVKQVIEARELLAPMVKEILPSAESWTGKLVHNF